MHMADALLSPAVAGTMWAASAGIVACCSVKLGRDLDDRKAPLMGVMGAFLFAAQMINFSIPATGSSGHLGGGLLLAILLGPCAAFLAIASVLVVQALFFADGGLLALGCNIFNMGFFPAFIVFPFFYRRFVGNDPSRSRQTAVTIIAAVIVLQLGSFAVVLETLCSGISSLPFKSFALLMQPIHLAIGLVEGIVTAAVVSFVRKARPDILQGPVEDSVSNRPIKSVLLAFLACAVITAGVISWFASEDPDGLEWSMGRVTGKAELKAPEQGMYRALAALQEKSAWFPGYNLKKSVEAGAQPQPGVSRQNESIDTDASVAGIVGTILTLLLAFFTGLLLKKKSRRSNGQSS